MTEWKQEDTEALYDAMLTTTTNLRRVACVIGEKRKELREQRSKLSDDIDRLTNNVRRIHDAIIALNVVMSIRKRDSGGGP